VALDDLARMSVSVDGTEISRSISADYSAFMVWLEKALS
jgi:pyrimidine-specific ribonucleoside hydrolase